MRAAEDSEFSTFSIVNRCETGPALAPTKFLGQQMPRGITAVGVFLFFGATMASFAGTTLTWPGTSFDRLWALNPTAHKQLVPFAKPAGTLFLLLAAMLALAGTGWFKHRLWGWRLANPGIKHRQQILNYPGPRRMAPPTLPRSSEPCECIL